MLKIRQTPLDLIIWKVKQNDVTGLTEVMCLNMVKNEKKMIDTTILKGMIIRCASKSHPIKNMKNHNFKKPR